MKVGSDQRSVLYWKWGQMKDLSHTWQSKICLIHGSGVGWQICFIYGSGVRWKLNTLPDFGVFLKSIFSKSNRHSLGTVASNTPITFTFQWRKPNFEPLICLVANKGFVQLSYLLKSNFEPLTCGLTRHFPRIEHIKSQIFIMRKRNTTNVRPAHVIQLD